MANHSAGTFFPWGRVSPQASGDGVVVAASNRRLVEDLDAKGART